ncbi:MAG: archaeosine biosynthesis radical SAM protein RaSEA [Thermoplasmatota archaeon]
MKFKEVIQDCHDRTSRSNKRNLITSWRERERFDGEIMDVFSVIFRTSGCRWSYTNGCSMCGYYTDTNPDITKEDLEKQLQEAEKRYEGEDIVKIYSSGSFLDTKEVPKDFALEVLRSFDSGKTVIESRPEFIDKIQLEDYASQVENLEIAIGLESSNDFVLKNCINKGFKFEEYKNAAEKVVTNGHLLRTYLLLKPPFLTEIEAIGDVFNSIKDISHVNNVISINPVNIQNGSLVEYLWKRKLYRPPWLWSVIEVLKRSKNISNSMIITSKSGLGSKRGGHNCSNCDDKIVKLLDQFNLSQDLQILTDVKEKIDCECYDTWLNYKDIESFLHFRGGVDILRNRYTGYI